MHRIFFQCLAKGVGFSFALAIVLNGGVIQAQGQSAKEADHELPVATSGVLTEYVSRMAPNSESLKFQTLGAAAWQPTPIAGMSGAQDSEEERWFALAKLALVSGCVFYWLRCLSISSTIIRSNALAGSNSVKSNPWQTRLFVTGLAGVGMALILPAAVWGMSVLVGATVMPYALFARSQNRLKRKSATRLSYLPILGNSLETPVDFEPLEIENRKGGKEPAEKAQTSSIQLFAKSAFRNGSPGLSQHEKTSPALQYVNSMISRAIASNATDIHINTRPSHVEVKQRVDGVLESLPDLQLEAGLAVINILKVLSEISIADRRRSQDGSFLVAADNRQLGLRVASQGTQSGEKLSLRILDPLKSSTNLRSLGMPAGMEKRLVDQLQQRHGLILFVGATGAGKSTTACASLQSIDTTTRNVVSIEDPIEYQIPTIDQIEVNLKSGQTFESALRSVLRLDADVIFVGEIRDAETAKVALQAAQSGQLVLATMHATNAVGGFQRLADLTGDTNGVASTVRAIVAQTLVRKLCPKCRTEYAPDELTANTVGASPSESLYRSNTELQLVCASCNGRRFMRRTGVYELVEVGPEMRELVRNQISSARLTEAAEGTGMIPLREQATTLVRDGVISLNELDRVLGE